MRCTSGYVSIWEKAEGLDGSHQPRYAEWLFNILPNDKILDWSKLERFADGISNASKMIIHVILL